MKSKDPLEVRAALWLLWRTPAGKLMFCQRYR